MNIIMSVNNNTLNTIHVCKLFYTIDPNCSNDAEFSAFSNEILFKVLEKRPKLFFIELDRIKNEVNYEYILNQLENPIHDGIEISKILRNIQKTELKNN